MIFWNKFAKESILLGYVLMKTYLLMKPSCALNRLNSDQILPFLEYVDKFP